MKRELKTKKKWIIPQLIVLTREDRGEMVLLYCKNAYDPPSGPTMIYFRQCDNSGCAFCSSFALS